MDLSLYVIIEFKGNNYIKISDKLKGWNFLTGMLSMSIKASITYQTIGLVITTFFLLILTGISSSDNLLIPFLFYLVL